MKTVFRAAAATTRTPMTSLGQQGVIRIMLLAVSTFITYRDTSSTFVRSSQGCVSHCQRVPQKVLREAFEKEFPDRASDSSGPFRFPVCLFSRFFRLLLLPFRCPSLSRLLTPALALSGKQLHQTTNALRLLLRPFRCPSLSRLLTPSLALSGKQLHQWSTKPRMRCVSFSLRFAVPPSLAC